MKNLSKRQAKIIAIDAILSMANQLLLEEYPKYFEYTNFDLVKKEAEHILSMLRRRKQRLEATEGSTLKDIAGERGDYPRYPEEERNLQRDSHTGLLREDPKKD